MEVGVIKRDRLRSACKTAKNDMEELAQAEERPLNKRKKRTCTGNPTE